LVDTKPTKKRHEDYDRWRAAIKQQPGQERPALARTLQSKWRVPWTEILKAVEEGRVPGDQDEADAPTQDSSEMPTADHAPKAPISRAGKNYVLDSQLRAGLIKALVQHKAGCAGIARKAGLDKSNLAKLERLNPSRQSSK